MIGLIVQLAISWLIIWLVEKKSLGVLGFTPTKQRLFDFTFFFLVTAFCCSLGFLMKMFLAGQAWQINPALSINLILEGIWWNIKSVLFEELIFRGVILYILIKRAGVIKAIIISAIAFGIYHWFSQNAFGNPMQMAIIFLTTGAMGLLLAYAYAKTFSLYIPIAIHLGWNFTQIFIFSDGPIGKGLFIPVVPGPFRTDSYFIFYSILFLPMISALIINYLLLKRYKQVTPAR